MTPDELDQRIAVSKRTLWGWRAVGAGGALDDTLALISTELGLLDGWAREFPDKAGTIGTLIAEWKAFREGLKTKAN